MKLHGLLEWLATCFVVVFYGIGSANPQDICTDSPPGATNCSCYHFAEGLFVECRGTPPPLHSPVNSLTIHELDQKQLTAALLPQKPTLRQLQISHSSLQDIQDNAFDLVKDYLESLILVSGNLKRVPKKALNGLVALRSLDLEANEISDLASYTFYGLKLFKLVLKSNLLDRVSEYAFAGLEKTLTELDLSENRLSSFPMTSLRLLDNLMSVRLAWNEISFIADDGVSRISSLRVLDLSSNNFQHVPANCFRPMSSLTTLTLFSNVIETVHVDAFASLHSLEHLDLSHNKIIQLDSHLFRRNRLLRTVDLTHNHIHSISGLFRNLPLLQQVFASENNILEISDDAFLDVGSLSVLRLQDNAIRRIYTNAFRQLGNLTELYLTRNYLEDLSVGVFTSNLLLTILHLDYNHLSQLVPGVFMNLYELRELRLDNNQLHSVYLQVFDSLTSLAELHLQDNVISMLEIGIFNRMRNLEHINLQNNAISDLEDIFGDRISQFSIQTDTKKDVATQRNLEIIWFGHNLLTKLGKASFTDLPVIQRIYFNNNTIAEIEDRAFSPLKSLVFLDLSTNLLKTITKNTFSDLYQLEELYISRNRIQSIMPFAFNSLKKLRTLDLSGNQLTVIHEYMFQSGLPIRHLNLRGSRITLIKNNSFKGLTNLNELNLEENSIGVESIKGLVIPGLRVLRLSWNPLQDITSSSLDHLQTLEVLILEHASIHDPSEILLRKNKALLTLSLSMNSLQTLGKFTFKEQRILNELKLSANLFENIPYDALNELPLLATLDLSHNRITKVDFSKLNGLAHIRELDLRNNQIFSLTGYEKANLSLLQIVYLNENQLSAFPSSFYKSAPLLRKLDVSANRLWQLPDNLGQLNWLNVSGNPLVKLRDPISNRRVHHLEELHVSHTNVSVVTSQDLSVFTGLLHLMFAQNRIVRISPSAFSNQVLLLSLDLSLNSLETLPPERLQGLRDLRLLNISFNRLKEMEPFPADLRRLQVLDVSGNQLTRVSRDTFHALPHLIELRLTANWISSISTESFKPLKKLTILDLSRNYLENLPLNVIQPLESQIRSLKAEENPLTCGCEQQEVWEWLRDHQRLGAGDLRCDQPPQLKGQLFLELSAVALCDAPLLLKLAIQDIQPYSFVVSWQSRNHSGLQGFRVYYTNQDLYEPVQEETGTLDRNSRSVRVSGLDSGAKYQVCVAGLGSWQAPLENRTMADSATAKCTIVRTLQTIDLTYAKGGGDRWDSNSVLTRRLGLIVGSCMGTAVFFILVSILGYLKIKKQRQVTKRDQPIPPEFISYSIYPTS